MCKMATELETVPMAPGERLHYLLALNYSTKGFWSGTEWRYRMEIRSK